MNFADRITAELRLMRTYYPDMEYVSDVGHWFRVPAYPLPAGWSQGRIPIPFEVKETHPGTPPYGLYVPASLRFEGRAPNNRNANPPQPPFEGAWALLSWAPANGSWRATSDLRTGSNLLQWVRGFADRFTEGL